MGKLDRQDRGERVLVVIVTWNRRDFVLRVLDDVYAKVKHQPIDVLVVDNASSDDTVEAVRERYPQVELICNEQNLGGTGGFNTGLRHAIEAGGRYDYVWLLDNDTTLIGDPLTPMLELFRQHEDLGAVGSALMCPEAPDIVMEVGGLLKWQHLGANRRGERLPDDHAEEYEVDYVAFCSALFPIEVIRTAGLLDERFFVYYDDVDFSLRIRRGGMRIIATTRSRVTHPSPTEKRSPAIAYYGTRNGMYFFRDGPAASRSARWLPVPVVRLLVDWLLLDDLSYRLRKLGLRDYRRGRFGRSEDFDRILAERTKAKRWLEWGRGGRTDAKPDKILFAPESRYDEIQQAIPLLREFAPDAELLMYCRADRAPLLSTIDGVTIIPIATREPLFIVSLVFSLLKAVVRDGVQHAYAPGPTVARLFVRHGDGTGALEFRRNHRLPLWLRAAVAVPPLAAWHLGRGWMGGVFQDTRRRAGRLATIYLPFSLGVVGHLGRACLAAATGEGLVSERRVQCA